MRSFAPLLVSLVALGAGAAYSAEPPHATTRALTSEDDTWGWG